jgi:hypothetical protein
VRQKTHTGELRRQADGSYAGFLVDRWGWRLEVTAHVAADDNGRFFKLEGGIGEPPPALRMPALDDRAAEPG